MTKHVQHYDDRSSPHNGLMLCLYPGRDKNGVGSPEFISNSKFSWTSPGLPIGPADVPETLLPTDLRRALPDRETVNIRLDLDAEVLQGFLFTEIGVGVEPEFVAEKESGLILCLN